jgi:flagellar biosynthesis protein FliR
MGALGVLRGLIDAFGFGQNLNGFLEIFGLALARISMAVSFSPFLGGNTAPGPIKMGLSILLTLLLLPSLGMTGSSHEDLGPLLFMALLLKELAVGLTIGVLSQLIFYAVQTAGALMDTARGMDQPGLTTPQLHSNVSILAQLKFQMALVLFLIANGHLMYLRGLALSFAQIPLRGFAHFDSSSAIERVIELGGRLFIVALQLAAPVLIALFLVDVSFGALGKAAPRMNVHAESQPVKAFAGLVILFLAIGLIATRLQDVIGGFLWDVYRLVAGLR